MTKKCKKICIVTSSVVAVILALLVAVGFFMVGFSLGPRENREADASVENADLFRHAPKFQAYTDSLMKNGILKDTVVVVDGLRRHAYFASADNAEGKTAIVIHGYKDNALTFMYLAHIYREELGFNVLLPDLYAHGHSDGDHINMGWKDRLDVLDWAEWAKEFFGGENPQMVIHGVSMGAATTMCVSGEDTPAYIKCFVEDCGYTSVWDEFAGQLKEQFGLPTFPILNVSSLVCRAKYGWGFKQASSLSAVAKCEKPMLFIHGDADTFVPFWMLQPLYEAKPEPKDILIVEGAEHARAFVVAPEKYVSKVVDFTCRYIR